MAVISMKQLLESGVHFGHQTRRWNPKMGKYIYTSRNGIHILDLQKTVVLIEEAYNKFLEIGKNGGKVLFVGTKKQAQDVVKDEAIRAGQYYVSQRWLGGTLTNFKTIRKSIRRLHDIYRMEKDGTFEKLPKKEVVLLRKELARLEKFLGGIKDMRALPEAIFIVDPRKERNAILEARKLKIPVYGIVDTNCDPDDVDYIIPANDDAIRSVKLIVGKFADALIIGGGGEVIPAPRVEYKRDPRRDNKPYNKRYNNNKPYVKKEYNSKPYVKRDNASSTTRPTTQGTRPAAQGTRPVTQGTRPVTQGTRPVTQTTKPVTQATKPVVQATKPVVKATKPVAVAPKVEKKVTAPVAKPVVKKESVDFGKKTVAELRTLAKDKGLTGYSKLKKADLIEALK